jgi:drug/metabolite transporter (DMT)-like permease
MLRAAVIGAIIVTALTIFSIIDCSRTEESRIRSLPKWAWLVMIIFVPGIGSIAWLVAGRPKGPGRGGRKKRKIVPPDDNPDWLKRL